MVDWALVVAFAVPVVVVVPIAGWICGFVFERSWTRGRLHRRARARMRTSPTRPGLVRPPVDDASQTWALAQRSAPAPKAAAKLPALCLRQALHVVPGSEARPEPAANDHHPATSGRPAVTGSELPGADNVVWLDFGGLPPAPHRGTASND